MRAIPKFLSVPVCLYLGLISAPIISVYVGAIIVSCIWLAIEGEWGMIYRGIVIMLFTPLFIFILVTTPDFFIGKVRAARKNLNEQRKSGKLKSISSYIYSLLCLVLNLLIAAIFIIQYFMTLFYFLTMFSFLNLNQDLASINIDSAIAGIHLLINSLNSVFKNLNLLLSDLDSIFSNTNSVVFLPTLIWTYNIATAPWNLARNQEVAVGTLTCFNISALILIAVSFFLLLPLPAIMPVFSLIMLLPFVFPYALRREMLK